MQRSRAAGRTADNTAMFRSRRPNPALPARARPRTLVGELAIVLLGSALLGFPSARAVPPAMPSTQVAWLPASAPVEVENAFARARREDKPLLLYWGASWCPPCNQLKATLFNRQDFAALSRSFVAVHVDGDRPGAQKLGQQFKVAGYPTLVLFRADGREITRLPGEAEATQVMELLRLGLAGGRPAGEVLLDARAGRPLAPAEWRMLAFYSWETDDEQLLSDVDAASVLAELAIAASAKGSTAGADTAARLWLRALAASDEGKGLKADEPLRARVRALLADAAQRRALADVLVNGAPAMVRALADSEEARQPWQQAFEPVLIGLQADAGLARADRLAALAARVELARLELPRAELRPALPPALVQEVRAHVQGDDRAITDAYERQAVIPYAAYVLERAGLWPEAQALLRANLARSSAPYYLMSQLGSLERKLGRNEEALRWYAQAFEKSQGPATRLQWGAGYLRALVDLAPTQAQRIEATARQLFTEAAQDSGAFYKRSGRSLQRVGRALQDWNQEGRHDARLQRLGAQLETVCRRLDAADGQQERCRTLLGKRDKASG